ncbi:MAG: substrate-binding domain-containing protein [Dokdonella sp.]|uniref:substrate-binding domain-containing protein n=1 Tax=Dokdonella sp. TaxID=2291710 RepID=UPI003F81E763
MSPRRFLRPLLLAAAALLGTGFAVAAPQDDLVWRGDHATGRAIMDDLAKEYAKQKLGKISLQPFSTVSGLDAVANGSADIAGSARGKYVRRAEEAPLEFSPVALDAAVLVTHPKNPVRSLTLKQVYDIYFGRIKNWKDLGGEDKEINLYGIAAPLDGVEYSLRELVYRKGDQPVAVPRLYLNTIKLEEAITLDPAGLGLSTFASVYANKGVRAMQIEGVDPSVRNVTDGTYPLYITLYSVNRADSPKLAAIDKFRNFLATPAAKEILRKHQLIPYADANDLVAKNDERMKFIDARVGRDAVAAAALVAGTTPPPPVAAPRATLAAKQGIAPTSDTAQAARENLARAEAKKQAEAEAQKIAEANAKKAAAAKATPVAKADPAPKKAAAPAKPKVAKAAPKPKATAKAEAPKAEAPKAPSFGNVSAGSTGH